MSNELFSPKQNNNGYDWKIVNDDVMGGLSTSKTTIDIDGFLSFKGFVSLENNGGFAMTQLRFEKKNVEVFSKIVIKIKGDGKSYQFRIKDDVSNFYSYVQNFSTSRDHQIIELPLKDFYPVYRGRKLDLDNFNKKYIEQIAILIGNKRQENFELIIKEIILE